MDLRNAGIREARRVKRGKRVSLPADIGRARTFDLHAIGAALGHLVEESASPAPLPPSVFDRVPTELLTEIFLRCRVPGADATDTRQPPWTLSHVCSRWRAAALACPALWQHVHVDSLAYLAIFPHYPDLLRTYLRRSEPLPLYITLTHPNGRIHPRVRTEDLRPDHERAMIDILAPHSERWVSADICLTFGSAFLERLRGHLPQLKHIRLLMYAPGSRITFLHDAPALTTFATPQLACNDLLLPWSNLAHYDGPLRFNPIARDPASDPLAALTNLVTLALRFPYLPPPTFEPIVFPRLRALSIFSPACLARITAPRLEVLALGGAGPAEIAAELLERSMSPNMRALRLQCLSLTPACLARIVAAALGLEDLRITLKKWPMQPNCGELYCGLTKSAPQKLRFLAIPCTGQWFCGTNSRGDSRTFHSRSNSLSRIERPHSRSNSHTRAEKYHPQAPAAEPSLDALLAAIQQQAPNLAAVQLLPDVNAANMLDETTLIRGRLQTSPAPTAAADDKGRIAVSVVPSSSVTEVVHSWANVAGAVELGDDDAPASLSRCGFIPTTPVCAPSSSTDNLDGHQQLYDSSQTSSLFPGTHPVYHSGLTPPVRRGLVRRYSLVPRERSRW
ncbi:hypothetical protein K523DRAFT_414784 [Schizophyllum commune Tattone D]|nr:hypothetical protein K523DRAFT_414784 [Schizophyllum commune Tattone D]